MRRRSETADSRRERLRARARRRFARKASRQIARTTSAVKQSGSIWPTYQGRPVTTTRLAPTTAKVGHPQPWNFCACALCHHECRGCGLDHRREPKARSCSCIAQEQRIDGRALHHEVSAESFEHIGACVVIDERKSVSRMSQQAAVESGVRLRQPSPRISPSVRFHRPGNAAGVSCRNRVHAGAHSRVTRAVDLIGFTPTLRVGSTFR